MLEFTFFEKRVTDGRTNGWTDVRMDRMAEGQTDGGRDGRTDQQTNGWTKPPKELHLAIRNVEY